MQYLVIYDDNPKKPMQQKVLDATATFQTRFGHEPAQVLTSESERVAGLVVQPNTFWLAVPATAVR